MSFKLSARGIVTPASETSAGVSGLFAELVQGVWPMDGSEADKALAALFRSIERGQFRIAAHRSLLVSELALELAAEVAGSPAPMSRSRLAVARSASASLADAIERAVQGPHGAAAARLLAGLILAGTETDARLVRQLRREGRRQQAADGRKGADVRHDPGRRAKAAAKAVILRGRQHGEDVGDPYGSRRECIRDLLAQLRDAAKAADYPLPDDDGEAEDKLDKWAAESDCWPQTVGRPRGPKTARGPRK